MHTVQGLSGSEGLLLEIYSSLLDDVFDNQAPKIFLYGGRGLGKSALLRNLSRRFDQIDPPIQFIDGRDWAQALETIGQIYLRSKDRTNQQVPHCFLDDLDHLISMVGLVRKKEEFEEMLRDILGLISFLPSRNRRVIITSTLPPIRFSEILNKHRLADTDAQLREEAHSCFEQDFEHYQLNPWSIAWQDHFLEILNRYLQAEISESVMDACQRLVLDLTGGHPRLFTSALVELRQLATGEGLQGAQRQLTGLLQQKAVNNEDLSFLLRRHLEDRLVTTGLSPLFLAINSLQNSDLIDRRHAFKSLVALATTPGLSLPIKDRRILQDEGLIYVDPDMQRDIIPGELLRRVISQEPEPVTIAERSLVSSPQPRTTEAERKSVDRELRLEPDPTAPLERGRLIIQRGVKELAFSGGPWVILKTLFENPFVIFSLKELMKPPLRTDKAVRSAVQRLQAKLAQEGLQDVVESVYGKGYRHPN